eukprot:403374579
MSANAVADKFGYEFHGNALQYLKVLASGTTVTTFQMEPPATLIVWLYILNTDETQYLFCKSNVVNSIYITRLCVYIEDGYYWGQVQSDKIKSETPVQSGWTMLVVQIQDSTETYYGNSRTQMQIIAYNGKWRHYNKPLTFNWRFDDDDSYQTYFGGLPFYNQTTAREEITSGFCDYCKLATHAYESCDLCRSSDSNTCLVYDDLTTAGGLFVASYSFDTFQDSTTNLQIIKDNGPSNLYHLQLGYNSTGTDERDPYQIDKNVTTDDAYLFTKTYIQTVFYNNTFRNGQHYYGFSLSQNNSAYFFINNTDSKQYCKTYFTDLFDPERDLGTWLFLSVSVSEFSGYSTNICIYKRGWATKAYCKILYCTMPAHTSLMNWYIGGKSFEGAIKTLHIWNYAKAINVMNYSPLYGLQYEEQEQNVDTKGDCNAFDPESDKIFLDYCPVCDKYTKITGSVSTCNSQCPFNYYDSLCKNKCVNDLCEVCLGGGPSDCQVCKPGASKDSTTSICTCGYADYFLSEDSQYCDTCDQSCYGCYGKSNKECYECESGYIPITDKDLCGSGVCCFENCPQYSKLYYYSFITNRCLYCGTGKYSLDGFSCTEMVFAQIQSLSKDMTKITIQFTRPVKHTLSIEDLMGKLDVVISGPRDSYSLIWTVDYTTIPTNTLISEFSINLQIQSTLYGLESIKVIFGDVSFLADSDQVPFGGPNSIETTVYSYSYLSDSDSQTTAKAGNTASQSSIISLVISVGVQFIAGGSVEAMFCLTYMMQICSMLPLMNLYFPSNAVVMFQNIAFVNVNNAFLSSMFTTLFFSEDDFSEEEPLANNFDNVGLQSKQLFMNSPDQLMMWIILASIYPFILFAKYMFSHLGSLCKKFIEIENLYHFNGIIKAFQQIFLTMMIGAIINIGEISPMTSADYYSYYSSFVFIGLSGFLFIFSLVFVQLNKRFLSHKKFQHTWGALILNGELKLEHPWHYLYLWTFLLRRTAFSVSVVILRDYPKIQLFIYLSSCIFIFLWHLILRPYKDSMLNFFYVFNELVLIICGCIMMLFLDSSMSEKESNLYGYLMIVIVVLAIVINWLVILPSKIMDVIQSLRDLIKKRDDQIRYQIEKKYLMQDSEYDQTVTQIVEKRLKQKRSQTIKLKQQQKQNKIRRKVPTKTSLIGYNQLAQINEGNYSDEKEDDLQGQDFFPINREVEGQEALNTLESFREAVQNEELKEEEVKRARTPLMDPSMKVRKQNATPAPFYQKRARQYRPFTAKSNDDFIIQRQLTPLLRNPQMLLTRQEQNSGLKLNSQYSESLQSLQIDDQSRLVSPNIPHLQNQDDHFPISIPRSLTPVPLSDKQNFDIYRPQANKFMNEDDDEDAGIPYSANNDNLRMNLVGFASQRMNVNLDKTESQLLKNEPKFQDHKQRKISEVTVTNKQIDFL